MKSYLATLYTTSGRINEIVNPKFEGSREEFEAHAPKVHDAGLSQGTREQSSPGGTGGLHHVPCLGLL